MEKKIDLINLRYLNCVCEYFEFDIDKISDQFKIIEINGEEYIKSSEYYYYITYVYGNSTDDKFFYNQFLFMDISDLLYSIDGLFGHDLNVLYSDLELLMLNPFIDESTYSNFSSHQLFINSEYGTIVRDFNIYKPILL